MTQRLQDFACKSKLYLAGRAKPSWSEVSWGRTERKEGTGLAGQSGAQGFGSGCGGDGGEVVMTVTAVIMVTAVAAVRMVVMVVRMTVTGMGAVEGPGPGT